MEKVYLDPDEVRSKLDINMIYRRDSPLIVNLFDYWLILVDVFLPSYSRWSIQFMKQILTEEKK